MTTNSNDQKKKKKQVMYVVVENAVRYDDEYHSVRRGGSPRKLFPTNEQAENYCRELNTVKRGQYDSPEDFECESWDELPDFYEVIALEVEAEEPVT